MILTRSTELGPEDIVLPRPDMPRTRAPEAFFALALPADGTPPTVDAVSQAYVERVLRHFDGRRMAAAQALGVSYPTFLRRLREMGLDDS